MAGVQKIEAAVREDHPETVAFLAAKPQNRLLQSECRLMQRNPMRTEIRMSVLNNSVYHAQHDIRSQAGWTR